MSLLDTTNEFVTIYPETTYVDGDGNTIITADFDNPVRAWVRLQPAAQSGTSARRSEQDNEGFESEEAYKLRFSRGHEFDPGLAAQLDWNGTRWSFFGYPLRHNGSPRTRRLEFTVQRT